MSEMCKLKIWDDYGVDVVLFVRVLKIKGIYKFWVESRGK